ncbi:MAG: hypothetical protein ACYSTL_08505, partial [Planctomycetota bacterium]
EGDADKANIAVAAASLPNCTTQAAEVVLPVAMAAELNGTYLLDGEKEVQVSALMRPPAGVLSASELVGKIAAAAGTTDPKAASNFNPPKRLKAKAPRVEVTSPADPPGQVLLLARQATQSGCGALTGYGSYQRAMGDAELRISGCAAEKMNLKNLSNVCVGVNGKSICARVRIDPELSDGLVVLPEHLTAARAMVPSRIDTKSGRILSEPAAVDVSI